MQMSNVIMSMEVTTKLFQQQKENFHEKVNLSNLCIKNSNPRCFTLLFTLHANKSSCFMCNSVSLAISPASYLLLFCYSLAISSQQLSLTIIIKHCHQPSASTMVINHCHQPSLSTMVINHHHQPSSSTIIINHPHQPSSSTMNVNHHHKPLSSTIDL